MPGRPHPFPGKLTLEEADELRRLRRDGDGVSLADLAMRFNIAKSSVSAIVQFHAHVPDASLRIQLPEFEHALVR